MDYSQVLGLYFGEPELATWLQEQEIKGTPVLPRGDFDAYLSKATAGIELIFTDSEAVTSPERNYPDGALVLSNISFYGEATDDFSVFTGKLPSGISFDLTSSDLIDKLGTPEWKSPRGNRIRWDMGRYRLHVTLGADNCASIVSVGLPI